MSNVHERAAQNAGLNTTYPGFSEYSKRYREQTKVDYENAMYISHSVPKEHIQMHNLRNKRFKEPENYFKITGVTENRFRYQNTHPNLYKKQPVKRIESELSIKDGIFIVGNTEYSERFNQIERFKQLHDLNNPPFIVNPQADNVASCLNNRPFGEANGNDNKTQHQYTFNWPDAHHIDRLPWRK